MHWSCVSFSNHWIFWQCHKVGSFPSVTILSTYVPFSLRTCMYLCAQFIHVCRNLQLVGHTLMHIILMATSFIELLPVLYD